MEYFAKQVKSFTAKAVGACTSAAIPSVTLPAVGLPAEGVAAGALTAVWHSTVGHVVAGSVATTLQSLGAASLLTLYGGPLLGVVVIGGVVYGVQHAVSAANPQGKKDDSDDESMEGIELVPICTTEGKSAGDQEASGEDLTAVQEMIRKGGTGDGRVSMFTFNGDQRSCLASNAVFDGIRDLVNRISNGVDISLSQKKDS